MVHNLLKSFVGMSLGKGLREILDKNAIFKFHDKANFWPFMRPCFHRCGSPLCSRSSIHQHASLCRLLFRENFKISAKTFSLKVNLNFNKNWFIWLNKNKWLCQKFFEIRKENAPRVSVRSFSAWYVSTNLKYKIQTNTVVFWYIKTFLGLIVLVASPLAVTIVGWQFTFKKNTACSSPEFILAIAGLSPNWFWNEENKLFSVTDHTF